MPVDRESWFRQLDLSNFVNAYYQFRDLSRIESCRRVLIVGPGQGLQTEVLKWRGYQVTTLDIDETFKPDIIGSVHDMNMFKDKEFDAVIASHVLEHLAVAYLDRSLGELARVAAHALIYLPVAGRHMQARLQPGFKGIDVSVVLDVFNYLHRPDGVHARYCGGQHFWEVGMRGFRVKDLKRRMSPHFQVVDVYRNRDWNPSVNFVLRSKRAASM
jgi:SAM-dependent methyltransferase